MVTLLKEDKVHLINVVAAFKRLQISGLTGEQVFLLVQGIARLQQLANHLDSAEKIEAQGIKDKVVLPIKSRKKNEHKL